MGDSTAVHFAANQIAARGECIVEVHLPNSGASGTWYALADLSDPQRVWAQMPAGAVLFAYRDALFPTRGVVDEGFEQLLEGVTFDGRHYSVFGDTVFPKELECLGSGNEQSDFAHVIPESYGRAFRFGEEPRTGGENYLEKEEWESCICSIKS